jgi:hypothetical protein
VRESPVEVELVLELEFLFKDGAVTGNGSISQVRPEDKMATDLQNGDIIVLSRCTHMNEFGKEDAADKLGRWRLLIDRKAVIFEKPHVVPASTHPAMTKTFCLLYIFSDFPIVFLSCVLFSTVESNLFLSFKIKQRKALTHSQH